jgi:hypothetical protein
MTIPIRFAATWAQRSEVTCHNAAWKWQSIYGLDNCGSDRVFGPGGATESSQGWSEALRAEPLVNGTEKDGRGLEPRRGERFVT